jgi:hypothetical protein
MKREKREFCGDETENPIEDFRLVIACPETHVKRIFTDVDKKMAIWTRFQGHVAQNSRMNGRVQIMNGKKTPLPLLIRSLRSVS